MILFLSFSVALAQFVDIPCTASPGSKSSVVSLQNRHYYFFFPGEREQEQSGHGVWADQQTCKTKDRRKKKPNSCPHSREKNQNIMPVLQPV